jgi:hypothetical protein
VADPEPFGLFDIVKPDIVTAGIAITPTMIAAIGGPDPSD